MNHRYNPRLRTFSRNLRNHSTRAEVRLWCELLRNRQMLGYPFLRQRAIDKYIADFFCKHLMLVIEVDGESHTLPEVVVKDERKTADLQALGYTVLRFTDAEVMEDLDYVYLKLVAYIRDFERGLQCAAVADLGE